MSLFLTMDIQNTEKVNGRWAMVGFIALIGAYVTTGQIIPGILNKFSILFRDYIVYNF